MPRNLIRVSLWTKHVFGNFPLFQTDMCCILAKVSENIIMLVQSTKVNDVCALEWEIFQNKATEEDQEQFRLTKYICEYKIIKQYTQIQHLYVFL